MALNAGSKLGPYEIVGAVGAGGMGEVYRARDTRLDRTVAIKVLPEQFSQDADLKQRFEREARAISSLNHPNICTLYDVGHQDGVDYLVMEFVEGETLSNRLHRGALPLEQVLKTGTEIAEALDKAHRQGIVHRDLKPGNVMLTKSGAKLLDFGLAKPAGGMKPVSGLTGAATQSNPPSPITQQGHIVGTFQYMSPEQVEGKEADARSDIFALGAVLYEMATGKRAFEGKSAISVASAILEKEPEPISRVQPLTPASLEHVVVTCLAKEPEERWQSAADVARELKWVAQAGATRAAGAPEVVARRSLERAAWGAAVAVLALVAVYAGWMASRGTAGGGPVHLEVTLPEGVTLFVRSVQPLAISPDGMTIVYAGTREDGTTQLYRRRLDSEETTAIAGSEGATHPFFSPDGEWVGFADDKRDKLKKVPLRGGSAVTITDGLPVGGYWAPDGTIYYVKTFTSGLYAVPETGGTPKQLTKPGTRPDDRAHIWPDLLPGGKALIFTTWTGASFNDARIEGVRLKTGERKVLVEGGTGARYVAPGYLVYAHDGNLFAVAFDAERLEVKGAPAPVVTGVMTRAENGDACFAVAGSGTLVYVPGGFTSAPRELVWVDRSGRASPAAAESRPFATPRFSRDGKRVLLTEEGSSFDVWLYDMGRGTLTKESFGGDDYHPMWSPDETMFAYDSSRSGHQEVWMKPLSSPGGDQQITQGAETKEVEGWTPDGKELIFSQRNKDTGWDIYAVEAAGEHKVRPLVVGPFDQHNSQLSPDGKWLAYVSNESGVNEVYAQAMSDAKERVQVSNEGGTAPTWSRSSKELLYRSSGKVMSVAMGAGPGLNPGKPALLFTDKTQWYGYDIAADGRLLVAREAEIKGAGTKLDVVLHWTDELKAAVKK